VQRHGKWVTADNRRLWVFRQLERLGKCDTIPVRITNYIPVGKLTSYNGGESVVVRGSPGGYWHNRPTPGQRIYQIDEEIRACNDSRSSPHTQASREPKFDDIGAIPARNTSRKMSVNEKKCCIIL